MDINSVVLSREDYDEMNHKYKMEELAEEQKRTIEGWDKLESEQSAFASRMFNYSKGLVNVEVREHTLDDIEFRYMHSSGSYHCRALSNEYISSNDAIKDMKKFMEKEYDEKLEREIKSIKVLSIIDFLKWRKG